MSISSMTGHGAAHVDQRQERPCLAIKIGDAAGSGLRDQGSAWTAGLTLDRTKESRRGSFRADRFSP